MKELIQTGELQNKLASANPPLLIDVRLKEEFKCAHIPGALTNCVYEVAFKDRLAGIAPDFTRQIVVYGADSESYEARTAAEKLLRAGYTSVYEYRDGLAAWRAAGNSISEGEKPLAEPRIADGVHPVDLAQSWVEWTGRNLLNKHYGRIGLGSGQLEFAQGQLNLALSGKLTLKDVSGPLTFLAAAGVTPNGKAAAQATLSLDRTRWNVLYASARFFNRVGMHLVNDLIDLEIKIVTQ